MENREGLQKMFASLTHVHKASFFRRVIFKQPSIPAIVQEEFAEEAFFSTWENLTRRIGEGAVVIDAPDYTERFFAVFKKRYLRALGIEFTRMRHEPFHHRTRQALNRIGKNYRQMLIWRYVEGVSHEAIAERKKIDRVTSIKMIDRCGRRFSDLWHHYAKQKYAAVSDEVGLTKVVDYLDGRLSAPDEEAFMRELEQNASLREIFSHELLLEALIHGDIPNPASSPQTDHKIFPFRILAATIALGALVALGIYLFLLRHKK
jgi:hypothetical protein